jgi:hypothetical protein
MHQSAQLMQNIYIIRHIINNLTCLTTAKTIYADKSAHEQQLQSFIPLSGVGKIDQMPPLLCSIINHYSTFILA